MLNNLKVERTGFEVGIEANAYLIGSACYYPARRKRHPPTTIGIQHFVAIEIGIGNPALFIALNPPLVHLGFDRVVNPLLSGLDLGHNLWTATNDIQRAPGQQTSDRINIARVDIAPEPGGLEWDRTATTEGIADPGSVTPTTDAQFLDQFRQGRSAGAKMSVDLDPGFGTGA